MELNIIVRKKIATIVGQPVIICNNSDYSVNFDFDEEWGDGVKTARFAFRQNGINCFTDVVFTGSKVSVPILSDIAVVYIGVYAGELHTTTAAPVVCDKSILSAGVQKDPTPDVYGQIIEMLNAGIIKSVEINAAGHLIITKENGKKIDAGNAKGEKGDKGDKGEDGITPDMSDYYTAESVDALLNLKEDALGFVPANKTETDFTNKKLDYLIKLTKGQAWDIENGTTPAYIQPVPKGAKAVSINKVYGRTINFNQLFTDPLASTSYGVTITQNNISHSFTANGKATSNFYPSAYRFNIISGHKYFVRFQKISGSVSGGSILLNLYSYGGGTISAGADRIFTATTTSSSAMCSLAVGKDTNLDNYTARAMIFDLTQMFGADNEPTTIDEFKSYLKEDYYPYNAGTLKHSKVTSVVSFGDDAAELGRIDLRQDLREYLADKGYGQSSISEDMGEESNYIDFETKEFCQFGKYVDGEWVSNGGLHTFDISNYIGDDNLITVEHSESQSPNDGIVIFEQEGININIPISNETEYAINLSEAL